MKQTVLFAYLLGGNYGLASDVIILFLQLFIKKLLHFVDQACCKTRSINNCTMESIDLNCRL